MDAKVWIIVSINIIEVRVSIIEAVACGNVIEMYNVSDLSDYIICMKIGVLVIKKSKGISRTDYSINGQLKLENKIIWNYLLIFTKFRLGFNKR